MVFGAKKQSLRANAVVFGANTEIFFVLIQQYSLANTVVFWGKYSGIWGKYSGYLGGIRWYMGQIQWYFLANTVVFWANTVVFWANTVVFGGNYSGI